MAKAAIGFGPGAFANAAGEFNAYGFEILNRWKPGKKISLRTSYAYSRPSGFNRRSIVICLLLMKRIVNGQVIQSIYSNWHMIMSSKQNLSSM